MAVIQRRENADGKVRWTMRVFIGRDPSGKRKFIVRTFDGQKEAQKEARRLERMKDKGAKLQATSKVTFGEYLGTWLDVKAGQVRPRTSHDYRGVIARYLGVTVREDGNGGRVVDIAPPKGAPALAFVRMDRLSAGSFDELYRWMRDKGLSPQTILHAHVPLRMALKDAVRKGMLPANPTDNVDRPTRPKETDTGETEETDTVASMTKEEADRFLEAARSDRFFALWAVLLTGGLRPSEALGLKWTDVDMDTGRIEIQRALTRRGVNGWRLMPCKTKRSRRVVPLSPVAVRALREWRAVQGKERLALGGEYTNHGLVFATTLGQPLDLSNIHRGPWRRVMERAGLGTYIEAPPKPAGQPGPRKAPRFRPSFRIYDLRHTTATLLLRSGVSVKIVSERLGHAKVAMTLDVYSHCLPDMQQQAADAMEAMFG